MIDRRTALLGTLAGGLAATSRAQTPPPAIAGEPLFGMPSPSETIDLWPHGAPGMPASPPKEVVEERSKDPETPDRFVVGVTKPRLVVFRPRIANGAAMVIAPGGGYARMVVDKEGYEIAQWLAARGWTAFVLFYRLPGDGWRAGPDVALSDAQRAIRLVRARARDYGVDPARVGMMGFSAGGHLCGDVATRFGQRTYDPVDAADRHSARPSLAAPIYAVQSMTLPLAHAGSRELLLGKNATPELERAHSPEANVTVDTPPVFMAHAEDDTTVNPENSLRFRAALKAAKVPVETHLFTHGGHGFGLRRVAGKPAALWPELFLNWAGTQGF